MSTRSVIAEPKELIRIVKRQMSINQITSQVLRALGFIIAFIGLGVTAYGLGTKKGLSDIFVAGIVLMFIGAIIFIIGRNMEH
jgi:hypothetical protein